MRVQVDHAMQPCLGFAASGDAPVMRSEKSATLFGVVDVLGHGPKAAEVAEIARRCLADVPLDESVASIVERLHVALQRTRGAAAGLCVVRSGEVEIAVVGNVEVRGLGTRIGVVASPGIVGRRLRKLRSFRFEMRVGDRVAVYSDGLVNVDLESTRRLSTAAASTSLLRAHALPTDDATVVVADFCHD